MYNGTGVVETVEVLVGAEVLEATEVAEPIRMQEMVSIEGVIRSMIAINHLVLMSGCQELT